MTIDPKMVAAYADGELGPEDMALLEAAMAADPALAEEVAAHRALRATLSAHFAPILDMPVPDRLTEGFTPRDNVVDLGKMRKKKAQEERPRAAALAEGLDHGRSARGIARAGAGHRGQDRSRQ